MRKNFKNLWTFFYVLGVFIAHFKSAFAETLILPPHESYSGARSHGMGNAFVAVADDESAIFSNPAGIGQEDGKMSKSTLKGASFPNLTVAGNKSPTAVSRAFIHTDGKSVERIANALNKLAENEILYGRASFFPYLTIGRLQLGVLLDEEMLSVKKQSDEVLPSESTNLLSIYSRSQVGGVVGVSIPHHTLGLTLGVGARFVSRTTLLGEFAVGDEETQQSAADLKDSLNKTYGTGLDFGLLYVPHKLMWHPTIGVAARDVGDTLYKARRSSDLNEKETMNITAGVSVRPSLGKYASILVALECERLNDKRVAWDDKFKAGVELGIGTIDATAPVLLRAGWNARTLSYGATADLLLFKLDVGRYAELVETQNVIKIDERTIVRLSIDLRS